ncbi:hypothetical protein [Nocardia beijingensis]|uniref:hypothetical protein n=1 Tax=Nocardia beijingensis TaxID=95162 RepID=UPI0033D51A89
MSTGSVHDATSVEKIMLELHQSCRENIEQAAKSNRAEIDRVLHLEADIATWLRILGTQPESQQLKSAHRDFGLAFYAAMSGLYRQAFSSLRSFLEVAIGAAFLSSHELKRRQWVSGDLDISWSSIMSIDDGLYSHHFLKEFCSEVLGEQQPVIVSLKSVYRICSEYIHGNVSTSQLLPADISYDEAVCRQWLSVAGAALIGTMHCLMVRYYKDLPPTEKAAVEASLEEHFSHSTSVRKLLGLPVEGMDS